MAYQTSVTQFPPAGLPGMRVDTSPIDKPTFTVEETGGILPGRLLVRGSEHPLAVLPLALAADPDAIVATGASSASPQDLGPTDFDGVVGSDSIPLAQIVDLVLSSNTDWDATVAVLTGINQDGELVSENLSIPDAGNATVSTTGTYRQVTRLQIPAQTGPGGTFTLGFQGAGTAVLSKAQILGISSADPYREGDAQIASTETPYPYGRELAAYRVGRVWVESENAVSPGAPVYVRIVESAPGAGDAGRIRSDAGGGSAIKIPGARCYRSSGTLTALEVDFRD